MSDSGKANDDLVIRIRRDGTASVSIGDSRVGGIQRLDLTLRSDSATPSLMVGLPTLPPGSAVDLVSYFRSIEEQIRGFAPWAKTVGQ